MKKSSFFSQPLDFILGSWLPYVTWSLVLLSCVGVFCLAYYIYLYLGDSKSESSALKAEVQAHQKEEKELFRNSVKVWEYLSIIGYWPLDQMVRSFVRAIEILREEFGGVGSRYRLPWFLLVGAQGSGKTTLVEELKLMRPIGNPMVPKVGENPGLCWSFFENGVILDVQGDCFLAAQAPISIKTKWQRLLSLLAHFRVQRPIDGVILTIPLTELVGPEKLDNEALNQRANYISQNLASIEKRLGMKVPVYVVFTKCDMVAGFKEFARSLTSEIQQEIFGWSIPYAPGSLLQTAWVDQAFNTMRDALREAQIEIFSSPVDEKNQDGVILFPENLETLKEKITFYLMAIFQEVGYREGCFFRGLFFTGDISWQPHENENIYSTCRPTQPLASYGMNNPRQIIFSTQLIGEKIFPEYVLASPGRRRILASSRSITITRFIIGIVALGFILLFTHDFRRIKNEFEALSPTLIKISKSLENAPKDKIGAADQFDRLFYDNETKNLITSLAVLKGRNFTSWVFPPSWSDPIGRKLQKSVSITLNAIILKALYNELLYRLVSIIEDPLPYIESNIKNLSLLNPLETMEFLVLDGYVSALQEITLYINKYKELSQTKNLKDLEAIIAFLFDIQFLEDLGELKPIFQRGFEFIEAHPINIEIYALRARERLERLFTQFIGAVTGDTGGYNELVGLASELTSLGKTRDGTLPIRLDVTNLLARLNKDVALLSNEGIAWLSNSYFSPGDQYTLLMGNIYSFSLFGPDIANKLSYEASQAYIAFKERLKNLTSDTTGPLFSQEGGRLIAAPSMGLLSMQKALSQFVHLKFIKDPKGANQIGEIPVGTRLYWSKPLLEKAIAEVSSLSVFVKEQLPTYPESIQEIFLEIARIATSQNVDSIVGQAQTFVAESSFIAEYSYEADVRNQLENLTGVLPTLLSLLNLLESSVLTDSLVALRGILGKQVTNVLEEVSEFFISEGFYEPTSFTFDNWNGGNDAAYIAFGVSDKAALTTYLNLERERIIYLVQQEALPLLNFIASPEFKLQPENVSLITHWQLMIETVNAYLRKKPHNGIQALENFIQSEMNQITLKNCSEKLAADKFDQGSGFFLTRLDQLRAGMLGRCEQLSGKQALNHYDGLQMQFNQSLAHRFPFVGAHPELEVGSADPQAIRAFFDLYDATSESARAYLKQLMERGQDVSAALEFMLALEDVRLFFSGFLLNKAPNSWPTYDFSIEFRVNKPSERGANELIDWVFMMGGEKFDLYTPQLTGTWTYGMPVAMTFRWAANGPNAPASDAKQPDLSVDGFVATYTYSDPWSLLKLLMKHAATPGDFQSRVDPQPQTLFFEIPTTSHMTPDAPKADMARLFVRISLESPKKEGGKTVLMPFFPESAPLLAQSSFKDNT